MKFLVKCLLLLVASSTSSVYAQQPAPSQSSGRAAISGLVTKDPTNEPVKKVLVELIAENQKEGGDYTATTGPDGEFRIENILPGRYRLFAERTGYLDIDKHHGRSEGRVLTLTAGKEVKDLQIRLQAAAVVRGRVTDEDGDPMAGAEVSVMRQTFAAGHRHWEQIGAERTDDLGEYRIANLPAGNAFVSVNPPPDFKSLIDSGGATGDARGSTSKDKQTGTTYQTLYYPGTSDRSQATPIQLHAGDEFPANFSLTPSPSLSISGQVVNLPPRTSATIMLQSHDSRLVTSGTEIHKDGSFVIRDVSPGSYTVVATVDGSSVPMMARQNLEVSSSNLDGLRLLPQPGATVRGHLRVESDGKRFDPDQVYLVLEPADGDDELATAGARFSNVAHLRPDGEFLWSDVPPGNYYVEILGNGSGTNEDWFVKSVVAGGREAKDTGLNVNGGSVVLDLVASASGAVVEGVVTDANSRPVANAVVVAVPETRMRGRIDQYRQTVTDQMGHFLLRGLRAGTFTLFAWESVEGQAYYNPEFLRSYEGQGTSLQTSEGEHKAVQLKVIPAGDDQF